MSPTLRPRRLVASVSVTRLTSSQPFGATPTHRATRAGTNGLASQPGTSSPLTAGACTPSTTSVARSLALTSSTPRLSRFCWMTVETPHAHQHRPTSKSCGDSHAESSRPHPTRTLTATTTPASTTTLPTRPTNSRTSFRTVAPTRSTVSRQLSKPSLQRPSTSSVSVG